MKIYLVAMSDYDGIQVRAAFSSKEEAERVSRECFPNTDVFETTLDEEHKPFKKYWFAWVERQSGVERKNGTIDTSGVWEENDDEFDKTPEPSIITGYTGCLTNFAETDLICAYSTISYEDAVENARRFRKTLTQ